MRCALKTGHTATANETAAFQLVLAQQIDGGQAMHPAAMHSGS